MDAKSNKPLCLLDVDGVINAFGGGLSLPDWDSDRRWEMPIFDAEGFPIRIPKGMTARLASLAESFEMIWATTWEGSAHPAFGERLALGEVWPHVPLKNLRMSQTTWKLPAVKAFLDEHHPDRPVIWIDDDLHQDAARWAGSRSDQDGVPTALLRTDPMHGFGNVELKQTLAFARSLQAEQD